MNDIQWFPGHMAKTRRLIAENLKLIDIVVELLDARLPLSSRNPVIDELTGNKPRLVILNKCDLADKSANMKWKKYFETIGISAILSDCVTGRGINTVFPAINKILSDKLEFYKQKGLVNRGIKMMIVGIPNVGKSTFINKLTGRASAKTGDRPGITKGKQWIRITNGAGSSSQIDLLDTPGILWHKFDDPETGKKLAYTGAIKDEIMDIEELCIGLLDFLSKHYSSNLSARYKLDTVEGLIGHELLNKIARKRGFLLSGNELDTHRAASIILDEFRGGKLGNITLEYPVVNV